jgi:hypothetical protein
LLTFPGTFAAIEKDGTKKRKKLGRSILIDVQVPDMPELTATWKERGQIECLWIMRYRYPH